MRWIPPKWWLDATMKLALLRFELFKKYGVVFSDDMREKSNDLRKLHGVPVRVLR